MPENPNIFISYARSDGLNFARQLNDQLTQEGFSVWRDLVSMGGERGWWEQIEEALQGVDHMIMVLTPNALESKIIHREWRLARSLGVHIRLVMGSEILSSERLPRRLRAKHIYDLSHPEQRKRLYLDLTATGKTIRVPFMIGDMPEGFVERPVEFNEIKQALIDGQGDPVAITAALKGAGGYGKTALSIAICHDEEVQDAFQDGILRVELGENPKDLRVLVVDLIENLVGERPGFETTSAASNRLAEVLGQQFVLLVIDDVWRESDLKPFLLGGVNCARLITTRDGTILPEKARQISIHAPNEQESLSILTHGLKATDVEANRDALEHLARMELKRWTLLMKLVNGVLRNRVKKGRPLSAALEIVLTALHKGGVTVFDDKKDTERAKAVSRTIEVSLDQLDTGTRQRFFELAIFPEDTDIPLTSIAALWSRTGDLEYFEVDEICSMLADLSLVLDTDLSRDIVRFHDVIRQFLLDTSSPKDVAQYHTAYLNYHLNENDGDPSLVARDNTYFYSWYLYHLANSTYADRLDAFLVDAAWIRAKLEVSGPLELVADYKNYARTRESTMIAQALESALAILSQDPAQLGPQLVGRLTPPEDCKSLSLLLETLRAQDSDQLLPAFESLSAPSGEIRRFIDDHKPITGIHVVDNERILTANTTGHIRLWQLSDARTVFNFREHKFRMNKLIDLNGKFGLSNSIDGSSRVFCLESGQQISKRQWSYKLPDDHDYSEEEVKEKQSVNDAYNQRVENWRNELLHISESVVVSYIKKGVKLGEEIRDSEPVPRSSRDVYGAASPFFFIDIHQEGNLGKTNHDHWGAFNTSAAWVIGEDRLFAMCIAEKHSAKEGPFSKYLQQFFVWQIPDGKELSCFPATAVNPDENYPLSLEIVKDSTVLLFSPNDRHVLCLCLVSGEERFRLPLRRGQSHFLRLTPTIAAWLVDNLTIGVYDLEAGTEIIKLRGHVAQVNTLALGPENYLASGSEDGSVRLWHWRDGNEIASFQLSGSVSKLISTMRDFIAISQGSWLKHSPNMEITLLDHQELKPLQRLRGLNGFEEAFLLPDNRRLLTLSTSGLVQLWGLDRKSGYVNEDRPYRENIYAVLLIGTTTDPPALGLFASGENVEAMDLQTGKIVQRFVGHRYMVTSLIAAPDGERFMSTAMDSTAILWDMNNPEIKVRFQGHVAPVLRALFWSEDRVITLGFDGTFRLWDATTGQELQIARAHMGQINDALILPDQQLLTISVDNKLILWRYEDDQGFVQEESIELITSKGNSRKTNIGYFSKISLIEEHLLIHDEEQGHIYFPLSHLKSPEAWTRSKSRCLMYDAELQCFFLEQEGLFTRRRLADDLVHEFTTTDLPSKVRMVGIHENRAIAYYGAKLFLANLETLETVSTFDLDYPITSVDYRSGHLLVGDEIGRVHFFQIQ